MEPSEVVTSWIVILAVVAVTLGDKNFTRNVIELLKSLFQDDDNDDN